MTEHIIGDASSVRGWRRSSYSGPESGSCVEVLDGHPAGVPVRDSKQPHGPAIVFEASIWSRFVASLKDA
ncbi:DUF397 domain-containing protein [Streptomyces sp. PKU-MA01144]|uniref:DUF397 domain-containing protein n=1 Tax=Streptomyces sp. PKU-MA01144 TaxID=2729138 RepID=UPI00148017EA|nr:DUF397 domain-containing protein [Streptomyces sp. PKU-MA01144]NNJ05674.1 DUF397 domain-containing protein [Streptomyces sp. PKU-MA01144]